MIGLLIYSAVHCVCTGGFGQHVKVASLLLFTLIQWAQAFLVLEQTIPYSPDLCCEYSQLKIQDQSTVRCKTLILQHVGSQADDILSCTNITLTYKLEELR